MAAMPACEGPLLHFFFSSSLEPLVLHGVGAAAHVLLVFAVAGRFLFRRCSGLSVAKDGEEACGRGSSGGGRFQCHGVAACTTWALAAAEVLLAAYSCYLGAATSGSGWSHDAVVVLVDAAARSVAWLLLAAYLQFDFRRRREDLLYRGRNLPVLTVLSRPPALRSPTSRA